MIGATSKSEQFMSRSGNDSTKGSRKGYGLLDEGVSVLEVLSPAERRDSLKARLRMLDAFRASSGLSRQQAKELHDIQVELRRTRSEGKARKLTNLPNCFIDICRERMSKAEFDLVMTLAADQAKKINDKAMLARANGGAV